MSPGMLAVDVGGTFTDVIGVRDGKIEAIKVPSRRDEPEQSVLAGAEALGATDRSVFNHASTVGLNAVITRNLPKIGFLTTYGHRDMLDFARSWRPIEALTDPGWRRPFGDARAPLVDRYLRRGVRERMLATGEVLIALDEDDARRELERYQRCNIQGLAICLINAYLNPAHELRVRELAREVLGDIPISISSEVSPLAKEYARASTTVIDVFMKLIFTTYEHKLSGGLRAQGFDGELNFADSAATLIEANRAVAQPFRLVFSGPAAGAVASAHFGSMIGDEQLLCCDVGGTSSDISLVIGGEPSLQTTFELEPDMLVNALSVELGALGAGGGSIVRATAAGEIRVGPDSAGGDPGPACYGRGGADPTMTDAFLAMGILDPGGFNAGRMTLDPALAVKAFEELDSPLDLEQRIAYAYRIGLNNVTEGLIDVAIGRGLDPRDFSLVAFGAAGPLMLPAILDDVKSRRVIVPPYPGLFSALGLLSSDLVYNESRSAYMVLSEDAAPAVSEVFAAMEASVREELPPGITDVDVRRTFDGRLVGQSWDTPFVEVPGGQIDGAGVRQMIASFHDEYESRYGNRFEQFPVEGVTYRVQLSLGSDKVQYPTIEAGEEAEIEPDRIIELSYVPERESRVGEYQRDKLKAGNRVRGPAIIREPTSTTHVVAGQLAMIGRYGEIVIEREGGSQ
jgi:N-methylhydantoinase A